MRKSHQPEPDELRSPDEILKDIQKSMAESQAIFNSLAAMLSPTKNTDMFFQQLFDLLEGVQPMKLEISKKNDKLTIGVYPPTTAKIQQIILTGTPEQLEADFFDRIEVPFLKAKELQVKLEGFEASAATAEKEAKEKADKAKEKGKEPAKKVEKKAVKKEAESEDEVEEDGGEDAPKPAKKVEPKPEKKPEPKKEEKPKGPQPLSLFN